MCRRHQPGRLRTGNTAGIPAGPEGQVTAVTASGTGLGYGEGDDPMAMTVVAT